MQRANADVMNVRRAALQRRGCEFDLQQLAQRLPPQRLVRVVDPSTDPNVLQVAFGSWLSEVRLIELVRSRDTNTVFEALLAAAG